MNMQDHIRSAKVHFYRLGLGVMNTVTEAGWKLMTLESIRHKLRHDKVIIHHSVSVCNYLRVLSLHIVRFAGYLTTLLGLLFFKFNVWTN